MPSMFLEHERAAFLAMEGTQIRRSEMVSDPCSARVFLRGQNYFASRLPRTNPPLKRRAIAGWPQHCADAAWSRRAATALETAVTSANQIKRQEAPAELPGAVKRQTVGASPCSPTFQQTALMSRRTTRGCRRLRTRRSRRNCSYRLQSNRRRQSLCRC